jgi:threonine dehydratase
MHKVALDDIVRAKYRIQPYVHKTPLMLSETLSEAFDTKVYLKLESLQRTGAFKIRGVYNKILAHHSDKYITASSGNHGLGLAYAAKHLGIKAIITVPEYTPLKKIKAIEHYGAEVILAGNNWNESYAQACKIAQKTDSTIIHPFEDADVISGQGSIALEILEEIPERPTHFLASIGGGSMIGSCAVVMKELSPQTKVLGLQSTQANAMDASLKAGKPICLDHVSTMIESFATKTVSELTLSLVKKHVDEIVLIDEKECQKAALYMLERSNILIELSAAINIAALRGRNFFYSRDDVIVITICGGNYNLHDLIPNWEQLSAASSW